MRERKEISKDFSSSAPIGQYWHFKVFLEVLLDIRDLLLKKDIPFPGEELNSTKIVINEDNVRIN